MRNAIILHGKPSAEKYMDSNQPKPHEANWLPWLEQTLEGEGIPTYIPALPEPYAPVYEKCIKEAFKKPESVTEDTLAIGHSMGAGLWVRWMSENPDVTVQKLVLVAPWLDPTGKYGELFDFKIDPGLTERCIGGLAIFYSSRDNQNVQSSKDMLLEACPQAKAIDIPEYGHFMLDNEMKSNEFPEILEELL